MKNVKIQKIQEIQKSQFLTLLLLCSPNLQILL